MVIVFTSEYESENGQAVVTRRVVAKLLASGAAHEVCVYRSGYHTGSILSWLSASIKLWRGILFNRSGLVYMVCSRTVPGFVRDMPALLAALIGRRVVIHCHGSDLPDLLQNRPISWFVRFLYSQCEVILPCRDLNRRVESYVRKSHVCENFYDPPPIEQFPSGLVKTKPKGILIVWNSNIMASKGFFDVLEAVRMVVSSGGDAQLLCYGKVLSDSERSAVEVERELSLRADHDWFTYLGQVGHSESVAALATCDVVVLPSRYRSEMQPLAIIEAMCSGKRIIVSDTPSLRVTVGEYPAYFVPPSDPEALAECLKKLIQEKEESSEYFLNRNNEASEKAKRRFSVSRFDEELQNILFS